MTIRKVLFTGFLLAAAGLMLVQTLRLAPASRLVPLWVLLPTIALLVLELWVEATAPQDPAAGVRPALDHARALRLTLWGGLLLALVYTLGFSAAVPLYLAPYLRFECHHTWKRTLVLTVSVTGLFYVVFGVLLHVPFPEGRIG